MDSEQKRIARRFSAAAGTYDRAALAQPIVIEEVCRLLDGLAPPEAILEIGCGTGMLTKRLAQIFPSARIDAVDISERMIERARRRLARRKNVRLRVSDVMRMPGVAGYPLIVSASALHWMHPVGEVMKRLAALLSLNGRLVFGLMVEGTLAELREARLRAAPRKPPAGRLPSTKEVRRALTSAGLKIVESRETDIVILLSSAEELLSKLHDQGVTGGSVSLSTAPLNRSELGRLIADYDSSYRNDGGGVRATYRVAYFSAKKQRHGSLPGPSRGMTG